MADARAQAQEILGRIHNENPTYWPYGLDLGQFDGGLYLINKSASTDPVGFVGWQERDEDGKHIGYYAIGVLPEHRHKGFAKAAVTSLLREKAASVDEVRALVMSHNEPSKALARSCAGVTLIEKLAAIKSAVDPRNVLKVLGSITGAAGTVVGSDQMMNLDKPVSESLQPWKWDKQRLIMGALNTALGATGGYHLGKGNVKGFVPIAMAPTKDLAFKGIGTLHKLEGLESPVRGALSQASTPAAGLLGKIPKEILLGALGLGVGGLGIAAYSAKRRGDAAAAQASAARSGRVRVTLPTKEPGDAETLLDLPIEDVNMSEALRSRLGRDTRRRLYAETKGRTRTRKPANPAAPTEVERELATIDKESESLDKEASFVALLNMIAAPHVKRATAAQPAVPSPPVPGTNPALRQQNQRAVANSIDTSTAANPQIMKAQAAAVQAEQSAQMQVAQSEQAQAQKEMESQQKFQQQLAGADAEKQKLEGEKQVMQMELEKARIHGELMAEKAKAEKEMNAHKEKMTGSLSNNESSVVDSMTQSRLSRIAGRIKSATAAPAHGINANTGVPNPPPFKLTNPEAMQQINDHGNEYTASGAAPPINVSRVSYGRPLDWVYDKFVRSYLTQPPGAAIAGQLPAAQMAGRPDSMLGMLSRFGPGVGDAANFASQLQHI